MLDNRHRKEKEQQLAASLQKGDQQALAELYDAYAAVLFGLISRIIKDDEMAEAVLQRTFILIWEQRSEYDGTKMGFLTWLIMMAREAAIESVKEAKERPVAGRPENTASAGNTENNHTKEDDLPEAGKSFCNLLPPEKAALDLIYLKGYSCRQAAAELGIPVESLVKNLKMAIKHIGASAIV